MESESVLAAPEESPTVDDHSVAPLLGCLLVEAGLITEQQFHYVRRIQQKLPGASNLVDILEEMRIATPHQVREGLKDHRINVPIGLLLFELGYVRHSDIKMALSIQRELPDKSIGGILVENHALTIEQLFDVLALQLGLKRLHPLSNKIPASLLKQPIDWYRAHDLIPIAERGNAVVVAFATPLNTEHITAASREFGSSIVIGVASPKEIHEAIDRIDERKSKEPVVIGENVTVETVRQILRSAALAGVSDIHIEPRRDRLQVRFRQDGVLTDFKALPLELAVPLASRMKVLAKADISQKRRHQDGRLLFEDADVSVELRLSTYVSVHGETIVLRLLNTRSELLDIDKLGIGPRMLHGFVQGALDAPSGVVIVTGPTGSGKTTTLYSAVHYLNHPQTSIITAEDPVEYMVDGITQCSINPKIGLTYENTLKHIVRQDPDIIVIGEIRDTFSAETAIQAALTGHKVLTTFHTEDSIGGLVRLLNMNIEAFLISSTVVSVMAQRLVRRVCPHCADVEPVGPNQLARLGYSVDDLAGMTFKVGRGCGKCHFMGYKGRVAVFELLVLNELVKDAVISQKSSYEIRRLSIETTGMVTLLEDAVYKALQGQTTFEEIIRQIPRVGKPRSVSDIRRLLGETQ